MKTSNQIIDAVAVKIGENGTPASDYATARALGVTSQRVSNIRHGRLYLSKAMATRAARILGVEPGALITIAAADRERDDQVRASLLKVAQQALSVSIVLWSSGALAAAASRAICILCQVAALTRDGRSARRFYRFFTRPRGRGCYAPALIVSDQNTKA